MVGIDYIDIDAMLGTEDGYGILPVHKLDGRHQEIAVWASPVSKDGGDAHAVVDGVVAVVPKRDRRPAHPARILRCRLRDEVRVST